MTHADINDLETRDYVFKIGDREKGIQARYDENTDALIFPRAAFDYVCKLLNEALSAEPCDNAISRDAVLDALLDYWHDIQFVDGSGYDVYEDCKAVIDELPPVTQKSETGHWINLEKKYKGQVLPFWGRYGCSKCGGYGEGTFNYCPNCGCSMKGDTNERRIDV